MDTDSTLSLLSHTPCDLLLLDLTMPGHSGSELIREIRASHAALPILVVTMHNSPPIVRAALRAGPSPASTPTSSKHTRKALQALRVSRPWGVGRDMESTDRVMLHDLSWQTGLGDASG